MENFNTEKKDRTGIFLIIAVIVIATAFLANNYINTINKDTVSIQKYKTLEDRVAYLYELNNAKSQILYDVMIEGKLDSAYVLSISNHLPSFVLTNEVTSTFVDKQLSYQLDSICADWYESIPFMFMDMNNHDSAWVLNSDSYERSKPIVEELRTKYLKRKNEILTHQNPLDNHLREVSKLHTKLLVDDMKRKVEKAVADSQITEK